MAPRLSGHVEPVDRGRWRLIVETGDAHGRKRRVRTVPAAGKRVAVVLLNEWRADLARELAHEQDPTLRELCAEWMRVRSEGERPWRPRTVKYHEDHLRLHIGPALGERPARAIKPADLSLFYASLARAGLGETSRHHVHATIRAAYNWGIRNEFVARNPAQMVNEAPHERPRPVAVWGHAEVVRALREASGELLRPARPPQLVYVPLILGAWAGLRCGEICALRWAAVDFEGATLRVERSLSQTKGGVLHDLAPKTAAGVRTVPLGRQVVGLLREHKGRQDEMRLAAGRRWNRAGHVICRQTGEPVKPANLSSAWARFCRVHGLPIVRLHDLRHSFATAIFEQGGEGMLKVVQELLGHVDPAITAKTYLHTTPAKVAAAIAAQELGIAAAMDSARVGHSAGTAVISLEAARARKSC